MGRAERRERTQAIARRRQKRFVQLGLHGDETWAPPVGYYAKQKPFNCTCRKRQPGAPRRDFGMCDVGRRHRVYKWRQEARELNLRVVRRADF